MSCQRQVKDLESTINYSEARLGWAMEFYEELSVEMSNGDGSFEAKHYDAKSEVGELKSKYMRRQSVEWP